LQKCRAEDQKKKEKKKTTPLADKHAPWSSDSRHPLKRTFPVMFERPNIPSLMFTIARGPLKHTCFRTLTREPTIHNDVRFSVCQFHI
jgi:hypothetical protein